jgi:hypothetical protein
MRRIWILMLLVCLWSPQAVGAGQQARIGGMSFSLGFESYPGRLYYRLDGFRYINGSLRDVKYRPTSQDIAFQEFSLRAAALGATGFPHLRAGLELGISIPVSGHLKSWNVPAITPKLTGDFYFPSFC